MTDATPAPPLPVLGIIAGGGALPGRVAAAARAAGRAVFVVGLEGFAEAAVLAPFPHAFARIGAAGRIQELLRAHGCQDLVLIGAVRRPSIFEMRPDAEGAKILAGQAGRKAIVVLSDGIDTASAVRRNAAIEAVQRADALIYPIRFYDQKVFAFEVPSPAADNLREGKTTLERMARETGGGFFEVSGAATLAANFSRLEEELRNQYSLGYTPVSSGGRYRKIRVSVKTRGFSVQARDGYYPAE